VAAICPDRYTEMRSGLLDDVARILCVDNHEDTRLLLQAVLEQIHGYRLTLAGTAAEGLDLATTEHFDLIVLDTWLPDISGIELCRQIRRLNANTPILFYSAARIDIEAGLAAGAHAYIVKPADVYELELAVRRLVEGSAGIARS
jgi:DNA-binding response OmpR family regulator